MITLADNALTTPDRLMILQEFNDDQYDLVAMLINQASASIETELRRKVRKQTYSERITPTGSQELLLSQWPILQVDHVVIDGLELDSSEYSIEDNGILYKDDGWPWRGYPFGLAYDPRATSRNVSVVYTAGYILPKDVTDSDPCTLPADLEGLCMERVQASFGKLQSGGNAGLISFAISDVRWEWATETPASWQAVINKYRRWA